MLGENMSTMKRNTEAPLDDSNELGPEVTIYISSPEVRTE
jgi:hypothetical protein